MTDYTPRQVEQLVAAVQADHRSVPCPKHGRLMQVVRFASSSGVPVTVVLYCQECRFTTAVTA